MKTLNKTLLALVAGTVMTAGANAALYSNTTTGYVGQPYVGVKAGQFNVDGGDDATAYGVYGGYQFNPNWGAEVEYMGSDDTDISGSNYQYNVKTYGAYGTYKYDFPTSNVYAKGKLGLAKTQINSDLGDDSDTGLAGGVGLGYNFTPNMSVEAQYDILPSVNDTDVNAWTIGAHYKF